MIPDWRCVHPLVRRAYIGALVPLRRDGGWATNGDRTELVVGLLPRITCEPRVLGINPARHAAELRRRIAVVFSNPESRIVMPAVAEDIGFSLRAHRLRGIGQLDRCGPTHVAERPSHDLRFAACCEQAVLFAHGRLVAIGEPDAVIQRYEAVWRCQCSSRLHRMAAPDVAGSKLPLVLAVSFLPARWASAPVGGPLGGAVVGTGYLLSNLGQGAIVLGESCRQLFALRWIIGFMVASQVVFLGLEPAVDNTARFFGAILIAALLVLTSRVTALLDVIEYGLWPLDRLGFDAQRAALLLTVTINTIPVLGRRAAEVRDAQRTRGAPNNQRTFIVPFLIIALKQADELGDALTAQGGC